MVVGEAELALGANHAAGLDVADFGLTDLEITRKNGAGKGNGNGEARTGVGGAADDLAGLTFADIHHANAEAVGIGVLFTTEEMANNDAREASATRRDTFDLVA
jgi:hypothetical protein